MAYSKEAYKLIGDCFGERNELEMLDRLREDYPEMSLEEMRETLRAALQSIRAGMRSYGYELPDDDEETITYIRNLRRLTRGKPRKETSC